MINLDSLKTNKGRVPYFNLQLDESAKKELAEDGETILMLGLRFNYPLQTGIIYVDGKIKRCATIVSKTLSKGNYYYLLQNEKKMGLVSE